MHKFFLNSPFPETKLSFLEIFLRGHNFEWEWICDTAKTFQIFGKPRWFKYPSCIVTIKLLAVCLHYAQLRKKYSMFMYWYLHAHSCISGVGWHWTVSVFVSHYLGTAELILPLLPSSKKTLKRDYYSLCSYSWNVVFRLFLTRVRI